MARSLVVSAITQFPAPPWNLFSSAISGVAMDRPPEALGPVTLFCKFIGKNLKIYGISVD
ncbi:MAG: hypothetical protein ACREJ2_14225 [Planctomycetota bacterium]